MTALMERLAAFRASGDLAAMIEAIPYARFLGVTGAIVDDKVVGRLPFAPHLVGNPLLPALHGGALGALLESTAIFQLLWQADTVLLPKTINITLQYLRSGRPLDTSARAVVTKHGRRVAAVRAEAWQEDPDRPIAIASAHFLIVSRED